MIEKLINSRVLFKKEAENQSVAALLPLKLTRFFEKMKMDQPMNQGDPNMTINEEEIKLIELMDESLAVLYWEPVKSITLISIMIVSFVVTLACRYMIANYVIRFAPKERAINSLILIDQVSRYLVQPSYDFFCC